MTEPTDGAAAPDAPAPRRTAPRKLAQAEALDLLRDPFAPEHISPLPKETKAQREEREKDRNAGVRCNICGGWHHRHAVHLDYVGHAAATHRLLDADPMWDWQPVAFDAEGLPRFDKNGGLWIKLTVAGVTRLGYGNAQAKNANATSPGDREKEVIGDALRNAAMRFGVALELWHKGDLHIDRHEREDDDGTGGGEDHGGQGHDEAGAQTRASQPRARTPAQPPAQPRAGGKPAETVGVIDKGRVSWVQARVKALEIDGKAVAAMLKRHGVTGGITRITLAAWPKIEAELQQAGGSE